MFGYVNVYKDEMKIKNYNIYRAYYCGLCKKLGKKHNQLVRLSLNYDCTFLAVMLDSLCDTDTVFSNEGCIKRIGKRKTAVNATGLDFAADINVILSYYKLKDDIKDNHSLKACLEILPFLRQGKKIKKKYPQLCNKISLGLERLSFLEEMNCDITDKSAHEFAEILKAVFEYGNPLLADFGYHLGRLIYIMDAYDDMVEDFKKGNYNPANLQYSFKGEFTCEIKESMKNNLYYSMSRIAEIYKELPVKKNKDILDNIIYLGIRAKCDMILNERNNKNEKSL